MSLQKATAVIHILLNKYYTMPRRALLGNWFEEEAYDRDRKLLMRPSDANSAESVSEVAAILGKVKHHTQPFQTFSMPQDGWLRFYTPVVLQNMQNTHVLSLDLEDRRRVATGWEVSSTASPNASPQLRNAVILVPSPMPPTDSYPIPGDEIDIVHYGQPFYIVTVPELCENPLFLISDLKTPSVASRISGKMQHVRFSPDGGAANGMWAIDYWESDLMEDMRDRPVRATDFYYVRHHMTNAPLLCGSDTGLTDFGEEKEVGALVLPQALPLMRLSGMPNAAYWMFMHRDQPPHAIMEKDTVLKYPNGKLKSMGQPPQITDSEKAKRKLLKDYYSEIVSRMTPIYRQAEVYLR